MTEGIFGEVPDDDGVLTVVNHESQDGYVTDSILTEFRMMDD